MAKALTKKELQLENIKNQLLSQNNIKVSNSDGQTGEHKEKSVKDTPVIVDENFGSPTGLASHTSPTGATSLANFASPISTKSIEKKATAKPSSPSASAPATPKKNTERTAQKEIVVKKKHTIELNEARFEAFTILAKITGRTVYGYIDELIANELDKNKELIAQLKLIKK